MKPIKATRFTGINNRTPIDRLPVTDEGRAVRDALNVDMTSAGTFQRRPGQDKEVSCTNARCLYEIPGGALYADGDNLFLFDGTTSTQVGDLSSPYAHVAYENTPLGTVWSDGYRLNLYSGTSRRLSPEMPNPQPAVTAASGGALVAGTYGVMFSSIRADGQQSAHTVPVYVEVAQGGFLSIAAAGHTERIAVFVTAVDGEIFYRSGSIEVGQTSLSIPIVRTDGQPVSFEVMSDLPPGSILALHKGRLLSADGQALYYSLPYNYGLYRPAFDYILTPEDITLVAPVEGGVYLATLSETWWLPGGDIGNTNMVKLLPYGAVKGTLAKIEDSTDLMWFTPQGPVTANQAGQVSALQNKSVAFPAANAGASIWRESNGLRQFISAISTNPSIPPGAAVAGTYMEAEVIQP